MEDRRDSASIYDHPLYYDILFGWDRDGEADFYDAALCRLGVEPGGRLIEMGCGPGGLTLRLARRGWRMVGLDSSGPMLAYLRDRAAEAKVHVETHRGDMAGFDLHPPGDAACCPMGTFGQLGPGPGAMSHLRAAADSLRHGGLYLLDLPFGPEPGGELVIEERWSNERGGVEVECRGERIIVRDPARRAPLQLHWGGPIYGYSSGAFGRLVERSGAFEALAWYPECGQTADGISQFDLEQPARPPLLGRAIVALRRV